MHTTVVAKTALLLYMPTPSPLSSIPILALRPQPTPLAFASPFPSPLRVLVAKFVLRLIDRFISKIERKKCPSFTCCSASCTTSFRRLSRQHQISHSSTITRFSLPFPLPLPFPFLSFPPSLLSPPPPSPPPTSPSTIPTSQHPPPSSSSTNQPNPTLFPFSQPKKTSV